MKGSNDTVNKYRLKWKDHLACITENRIPRHMVDCQLEGIKKLWASQEKKARPNLRSPSRPWGLIFDVEEEKEQLQINKSIDPRSCYRIMK
jgi:hypothetical protein